MEKIKRYLTKTAPLVLAITSLTIGCGENTQDKVLTPKGWVPYSPTSYSSPINPTFSKLEKRAEERPLIRQITPGPIYLNTGLHGRIKISDGPTTNEYYGLTPKEQEELAILSLIFSSPTY
ncbi:Uncharacterised protein [uncultured archaeon]|nr:Uncharacterised protein [uncultured archaeon]